MSPLALTGYSTGILVPLVALRSEENLGAGEFADLPAFAQWCGGLGFDLIQLLPVNDTGGASSPYSARSAFALHPLYLRIQDLEEIELLGEADRLRVQEEVLRVRAAHQDAQRINYHSILQEKLGLARMVYERSPSSPEIKRKIERYVSENPWIISYAVFAVLKSRNNEKSWRAWEEHREPGPGDIKAIWDAPENTSDLGFHVWLQMRLEEQFTDAAEQTASHGVRLKGDLPILMSEDSADVWAYRDKFITKLRAGAPPDMFSHLGQNWGLPIYNWERMAANGYQWWKDRLSQAEKFYSAYRIDHVLGFFRVWAIPEENTSGLLGRFAPSKELHRKQLHKAGMDDGRIRWFAEPHITGDEIRQIAGDRADAVIESALGEIGDEDLYVFSPDIRGECDIAELPLTAGDIQWLTSRYADRVLLRTGEDSFMPTWSFRSCSRYESLGADEKQAFEELVSDLGQASERIWEEQARTLLGFMREASRMLPCAEDLGVVPGSVPQVLADLGMLGLRIPRWTRRWNEAGQPFIPVSQYPVLTVCAPSVHDTSTMRGWWNEEPDLQAFWSSLGLPGRAPDSYSAETARKVTEAILGAGSAICVFQIQDILALSDRRKPVDPETERVNVPGTVNEFNWGYRVPITIRELDGMDDLAAILVPMIKRRQSRPFQSS